MDPLKKVTDDLALLGGELSIDRFVELRNEVRNAAAPAPAPQPRPARAATPAQKPARPAVQKARVEPREQDDDSPGFGTGGLQQEIEAFMNRDAAEDTDDQEVQEFLKERAGFDPTDLG